MALPLELDGCSQRESRELALDALERVKIAQLANRFPDNLSGGEAAARRDRPVRLWEPETSCLRMNPPEHWDSVTGEVVMKLLRKQCDEGRSAGSRYT